VVVQRPILKATFLGGIYLFAFFVALLVTIAGYLPVAVALLIPEQSTGFSLYQYDSAKNRMQLYRTPEIPFAQIDIDKLHGRGVHRLFLPEEDHHTFQDYLRENLRNKIDDETRSPEERFQFLNEALRESLAESFQSNSDDEIVARTQELAEISVELLKRDDTSPHTICQLLNHDFHTFTHSANVSYYCVMLADKLGFADDLQAIGEGGLLHDLGKLDIDDGILTKPGRLNDEEFTEIKLHPLIGFRRLCRREDISFSQLMMVYQHHENMNGGGYPTGVASDEIHEWARICTVVDVYEALTSNRPYRRGMTPAEAFEIMDRLSDKFDPEMYQCWKQLMTV